VWVSRVDNYLREYDCTHALWFAALLNL